MSNNTTDDTTDESTPKDDFPGGPLHDLSIAPGSSEPKATREHPTLWSVSWNEAEVALALSAVDTVEDTYTAIAKGYLSFEEARRLRDALDRALEANDQVVTYRIYKCSEGNTSMPTAEEWDQCKTCGGDVEVLHETEAASQGEAYQQLKQYDDW